MREVVIAGVGQIPVGEHWDLSLRNISARAILAAKKDAGGLIPEAVYVGNLIASVASHQSNLGALVVDNVFMEGAEAYTVEAGEASSAAAFRMAYLAVASGWVDIAMAIGMEKYTDLSGDSMDEPIKMVMDYDYEGYIGQTLTSQAALLMKRYLHEYPETDRMAFAAFPLIGHQNAVNNPNAMYRKPIRREVYEKAGMVSSPMNMFDSAPYADGAAALILTTPEIASQVGHPLVRIVGSDVAIDTLALHDRPDPLAFRAAGVSLENACSQAGILPGDVDFFELHDAYSIYGVLTLEAAGFAPRGEGWKLAMGDKLTLKGDLPINTMGGLKARGYPLGASGAYQLVEAVLQLRGEAGENQIPDARLAMVQSLGGPASTAVTHILEKMPV
ncbi:MAG TPA: thiolase domain-containing protein [Anaerolineaceae bacterium]|nr:thiolase domain-containing protein [Anaerolineaceae bacterium]